MNMMRVPSLRLDVLYLVLFILNHVLSLETPEYFTLLTFTFVLFTVLFVLIALYITFTQTKGVDGHGFRQ